MTSRLDIFRMLVKTADKEINNFSYSATMRQMRKHHPEKVRNFMKAFKEAFDEALENKIEAVEQTALMQAIKTVG